MIKIQVKEINRAIESRREALEYINNLAKIIYMKRQIEEIDKLAEEYMLFTENNKVEINEGLIFLEKIVKTRKLELINKIKCLEKQRDNLVR